MGELHERDRRCGMRLERAHGAGGLGAASVFVAVALGLGLSAFGAETDELARVLSFEGPHSGRTPFGWSGGPPSTQFKDDQIVHGGSWSGRIERGDGAEGGFSTFTYLLPIDFSGSTLELKGFLRTREVEGWAGLWLREDGEVGSVAFDNMQSRALNGTTEWTEYVLRLPLERSAVKITFGALLAGKGTLWVDDLQLLVDGKPLREAPKVERPKTVLDTDREFDEGSKVTIQSLTPAQTANLAILGKVWGFLKYHHPKVVRGDLHWDYELFRVLPPVLAATDGAAARRAMLAWAKSFGDIPDCKPCASLPDGLQLRPDLDWIHDRPRLGDDLAGFLETVYRNRPASGGQAHLTLNLGVGNPEFLREKAYADLKLPDAGYRILALFRWWNIVQYWSPYRDVIGEDWHAVLAEFLPRLVAASDADRYKLELLALVSRLNDGHANLWSALDVRPPKGGCEIPVRFRFVEGRPVAVGYGHAEKGPASGLEIGDVLTTLDGVAVDGLLASWAPHYAASNDVAKYSAMTRSMTRGTCGGVQVRVERAGSPVEIEATRVAIAELDRGEGQTRDLPGPTFRRLSPEVGYLKLSSVKIAEVADYLRKAEGTKGLIVDIRNYPSEFMVFALGSHFVTETTPFARFTYGDLLNPGAFHWTTPPLALEPAAPHYPGKIVILVDETSMSQAEYTAMAFRAAPKATVVGSTTAGADGNVSGFQLPGGIRTMISGIGVFYPDKSPTQRLGVVPDIEVRPTIAGIREGRDVVLEAAVRQILGGDAPEQTIRALARVGAP